MAAPSGTVWGSIVSGSGNPSGRKGKLGIYTDVTENSNNTTVSVNVQVWFWTIYSCSDTSNTFYYNVGKDITSATTSQGAVSISHSVASGSGWSTSNQTCLLNKTYTYTRGTSNVTYNVCAKLSGIDILDSAVSVSPSDGNTTFTVPKLATYTITYNANGGSGAPSSQTKYYGKDITLQTTEPTRTGYSFQGWATSASGSVAYAPGATYSPNANANLYAVWKINTYTIEYDANGGSGAPSNQTKTYDVPLTLSTTIPERTNYTFLGWATSASAATAKYAAGGSYTANTGDTLFAVWELAYVNPKITNLSLYRCDADGNALDEGTCVHIAFDLYIEQAISDIVAAWENATGGGSSVSLLDKSGLTVDSLVLQHVEWTIDGWIVDDMSYVFTTDSTYQFTITVTDAGGYSTVFVTLNGTQFVVDFLAGGKGAAFGKPAELENVLDIAFQTRHAGGLLPMILEAETDLNEILTPNTYVGANLSTYNYTCGGEALPLSTGTFTLEVVSMGEDGQRKQRLIYCHKTASRAWERIYYASSWGDWICVSDFDGQLLWSGCYYMTADHTATLAEKISQQRSGIVLVFCYYNGSDSTDYNWQTFFVPKYMITLNTGKTGYNYALSNSKYGIVGTKYLYISDGDTCGVIGGNDANTESGTAASGITYDNSKFVLRYVIGV